MEGQERIREEQKKHSKIRKGRLWLQNLSVQKCHQTRISETGRNENDDWWIKWMDEHNNRNNSNKVSVSNLSEY